MASRELNILIRAKNLAGNAIAGVKRELGGIQKDIGRGLGKAAHNIERGLMIGGAAAVGGLTLAIKTAADFELTVLDRLDRVAEDSPEHRDLVVLRGALKRWRQIDGFRFHLRSLIFVERPAGNHPFKPLRHVRPTRSGAAARTRRAI